MWRRRVYALSLLLLILLALCLVSPVAADADRSTTSKKKTNSAPTAATSSNPSSTASSTASPTSPTSSHPSSSSPQDAQREARLTRKTTRLNAGKKRIDTQERRVHDKAVRSVKKYGEAMKRRLASLQLKQQRAAKAVQRSEAYWQNKKDSMTPAALKKGDKKLNALLALAAASPSAPIRVKASQFSELIATSPRPYWVLLSLTALSPSYDCKICTVTHRAFSDLAPTVHTHSLTLTNSSSPSPSPSSSPSSSSPTTHPTPYNTLLSFNATTPPSERERLQREHDEQAKRSLPIFIVEADIDQNREAFNALQLSSAPTLVLLPPSFSPRPPVLSSLLTSLASRYRYIPQSLDLTPTHFIDFINTHVEPKVAQSTSAAGLGWTDMLTARLRAFNPVILGYFSVIAVGVLLFLLGVGWRAYRAKGEGGVAGVQEPFNLMAFFLPQHTVTTYSVTASSIAALNFYQLGSLLPRLPLILSALTFYLFCVSGGMFTVIKESDAGYEWTAAGGVRYKDWISGQYMDQTVAESTVLAGLYASLCALLVLLNSRTFYVRREGEGWTVWGVLAWLWSWAVSPVGVLCCIALVYLQLINVYSKKNSYHWGMNWRWLNAVQWNKVIPYPAFHKYAHSLWALIMKRMW